MLKPIYVILVLSFSFLGFTQQSKSIMSPVGGTLIDGYGSDPIKNSVIIITGEKITAVGTIETLVVPKEAQIISTEGRRCYPAYGTCMYIPC